MQASVSKKVLIVEDEEVLAKNLLHHFRRCGWDARIAGTGELAIKSACQYRPELILFDYHLPDMNGFQALEAIRASYCCCSVLMTARPEDQAVLADARRYGIVHILSKPFPLAGLQKMMLASAAEFCSKYLANGHRSSRVGLAGFRGSQTSYCHHDLGDFTQTPKNLAISPTQMKRPCHARPGLNGATTEGFKLGLDDRSAHETYQARNQSHAIASCRSTDAVALVGSGLDRCASCHTRCFCL
ncbi:MAG TPA: response regulator [Ramlibacter sp.]|nr:response regulator [Ramlibacter sp.]